MLRIVTVVLRFLISLIGCLPFRAVYRLGGLLGWLVWCASPTYRRHLRDNLAQALGPQSPATLRRQAIAEAGRQSLELLWLWQRPVEEGRQLITRFRNPEILAAARAQGGGILFLTPHLGCFEITAQHYAGIAPITVLYREPKRALLGNLIRAGRERGGVKLAPADLSGVRRLIKSLRQGEAVGMLPDQVPGNGEGVWANFFGKPAYSMTLAARLSEVNNVAVVFAWGHRLPNGEGFELVFHAPAAPLSGTLEERVAQINQALEAMIVDCPSQYLWGYNHYKRPAGAPAP